jgi:Sel1 repeat-containing protein
VICAKLSMEGDAAMRWLSLLIASMGIVLSGTAFALPQPDAEAAYARGDYATAFQIWLPLAEQGSVQAQLNVARMYERGEWVAQDKRAAMEWYNKAAAQNARDGTMPAASNVASAVPGTTPSTGPPSPATYPWPTSYPAPSPVVVPVARPVFVPVFRFHRHRH